MATGIDVLTMLCPQGGWIIVGDDFDGITWVDERPRCTKAQFEAGFAQYDAWKAEQEAQAQAKRQVALAKLAALGLEPDDLTALGL
jgi:hypothetical protein